MLAGLLALIGAGGVRPVAAADATWTGATDGVWSTTTNWTVSPVPGTGDVATFADAGNGNTILDLGTGVTLRGVLFDSANAAAYTIGSGPVRGQSLVLDNSGTVTMNAAVAANESFNANVSLGTATAGSYTFTNSSTTNRLIFNGNVQGGTGGTGAAKTLTVDGVGDTVIAGPLLTGGASSLALTKTGNGTLFLSGMGTYAGATAINGGVVRVQSQKGLGATSGVTVAAGATLALDGSMWIDRTLNITGSGFGGNGALRNIAGAGRLTGAVTLSGATRLQSDAGILRLFGAVTNGANPLTVGGAGDTSLWGVVGNGAGGVVKEGGGMLRMAAANTYTGPTTVNDGIIFLATGENAGTSGPLGKSVAANPGSIVFGGGWLQYSTANSTDYSGRFSTAAGQHVRINTSSQSITFATPLTSSGGSLTVNGQGTLTLTGLSTYSGTTTVTDTATLALNLNTAAGNNVVSSSSALVLGGNLNVIGAGGTTPRSQTFNGTTFGRGGATITPSLAATSTTADVLTLDFGALSRVNGGTANPVLTQGNTSLTNTQLLTTTGTAGGLITDANGVAYMTFATSGSSVRNWAVKDVSTNKIVEATSGFYTAATATTLSGNADIGAVNPTVDAGSGTITVDSMRFDNASARTVTLNGDGSGKVSVGGIFVTNIVGNNANLITGTAILQGPNGGVGDLVVHNYNSGNTLRVASVIGGTGGFTKAGPGTVILDGTNTYSGPTSVNAGTLQVGNGGATGDLGATTGGILVNGTLTFNRNAASSTLTIPNNVFGSGGLTQQGAGTTVLQGTLTYRGLTTVNAGTLTFAAGSSRPFTSRGNVASGTRGMDGNGLQVNGGVVNVDGLLDVENTYILGGVVNVSSTGTLLSRHSAGNGFFGFSIGTNEVAAGTYGMLNMTGGSVNNINDLTITGTGGPRFGVGIRATTVPGLVRMSGGTLNAVQLFTNNAEITLLGGTLDTSGAASATPTTPAPNLNTNEGNANTGGALTVVNVVGGTFSNPLAGMNVNGGTAGASRVVVNVNSGTLWTQAFTQGTGSTAGINFNGGTLRAGATSATFTPVGVTGTSTFTNYVNGPFGTSAGGAVIDTDGYDITIPGPLLAPTGSGVSEIPVILGGSGYVGAPLVTIADAGITQAATTTASSNVVAVADTTNVFVGQSVSGTGIPAGAIVTAVTPNTSITLSQNATAAGAATLTFRGLGATAYATIASGAVSGIVITNPGVGYAGAVSTTLTGGLGSGGVAATLGSGANITMAANTSGGLTKVGAGTLTLSGATTFTGSTAVNQGTLAFGLAAGTTTYPSSIAGVGSVRQAGAGTTILTGTNTYTGPTVIAAGVLRPETAAAIPGGIGASGGTSPLVFSGGVLGLAFGDFERPLGAATAADAANFTGVGGWAAYGADRVVNIGGSAVPTAVAWATANTGFNGQTVILGHVTGTHMVDVLNPLDLGNAVRTVQVDNGVATADGRLGGALTGTGSAGVTKTGSGTLVLGSTANAYSGATTISAGTLLFSTNNVIPDASAVSVSGNAANVRAILDVNGRSETIGTLTLGGSTATSTATVATGAGMLTLGGDVTYSSTGSPLGATIMGNLALGAASRTLTVNDSTSAAADLVVQAAISGAGVGLTKSGAGTLLLSGANTYTGTTVVSAGTLTAVTRSALANDTPTSWTPTNIAVNSGATLALGVGSSAAGYFGAADIDTLLDASHLGASTTTTGLKTGSVVGFDTTNATAGAFTYSSVIADTAGSTPTAVSIAKLGPGTLTLGGNNSYTGTTTVSQGTLVLTGANTGSGTVTVAGGVLRADQGVGLNSGSLLTLSGGAIETGANLERTGGSAAGNMQITGGTSGFSAAGSPVQVAFGTLASPTALTWGTAPFAPGTLLLNASTATSTLDFKNAVSLVNTARTIQVDANVATMSGVVSNTGTSGTLTKTGNGTLILSANNTYNAATVVTAGTLLLTGSNASTGTLTARSGGTIKVNGATGSIAAAAALTLGNASFAGGGSFVYDNVGASGSTSQTIASLTTSISQPDDNTVQVIRTAAQPVSLIITAVSGNSTEHGNVVNFVTTDVAGGGVNGTDFKIVLGNQTSGLKITTQNAYYNGSDFAVYQGSGLTGYVRGILYGTDANTATSAGGASFANPGTLTSQEITGAITAQPTTTLASGTLNGSLKIVGTSDLTMQINASLTFNGAGNSGAGGILKTGGGTATISGGAGTTGFVSLANTQGDIRVDGATDVLAIAMPVTWGGATRLLKSGAGTLIFSSGTLPFTDSRNSMYVNAGTFEIGGNAFHNGTAANQLVLASGALFRYSSSSVASFRSGTIQGAGSVQVTSGALALTNTGNSYTGTTTLTGGTLTVAALANGGVASSMGQSSNAAANLVFGGGTLQYTGSTAAATDRLFTIGNAAGNAATLDASGTSLSAFVNFSNTDPIAFGTASPRTLTLTGSNAGANTLAAAIGENAGATSIVKSGAGSWTLSGRNTYSGTTTISAGTLEVAVGSAIGDTSAVSIANVAGARLLVSSSETIGSLSGGGVSGGDVALGFNTLTLGDATSTSFAGVISGVGGSLVKQGAGSLVLTGLNTYTGGTAINAGTLSIGSAGTINGTSGVLVTGSTFNYDNATTALTKPLAFAGTGGTIGGTGLIGVDLVITSGNTLSPGNSPGILSQNGNQTWSVGGNYNWQMYDATAAAGTGFDRMTINGSLSILPGFNFNIWSLSAVGPDSNGAALNFDPNANGSWIVASASSGLVNATNLSAVSIFTAANNGTGGFANTFSGTFSLMQGDGTIGTVNDVVLMYTVPEPGGCLPGLLGVAAAAAVRRWHGSRRRR